MKKKRSLIIVLGVLMLLIVGSYLMFRDTNVSPYEYVEASRGSLTQEVSVTGKVVPAKEVALAFESGGKVSRVYIEVGERVGKGDILMSLGSADVQAQLAQAEASVAAEEATLQQLKKGTRPEELRVYETKVSSANIALDEAAKSLVETLQDSSTKADDAIFNRVDQLYTNPRTTSPKIIFFVNDDQLKIALEQGRFSTGTKLADWESSLAALTSSDDLGSAVSNAKDNLTSIRQFLNDMASAVNGLTPTASLSQTTITAWKTDISLARTNVSAAITAISTAETAWKNAKAALDLAMDDLSFRKAGATVESIAAQEARIEQAEAQASLYKAQLAKTAIYAPIGGTITRQDVKVGEIVTPNVSVIGLISDGSLEMEAYVPEADVAKIALGQDAQVTLDAYGDGDVFGAAITKIDPTETVKEGVSTYKTTLQFVNEDERPRSGMTANITVRTGMREDTILIPGRAVFLEDGTSYVNILRDEVTNTVEKVPVTVGLRGTDGNIEIVSGVAIGDKVITFTRTTN